MQMAFNSKVFALILPIFLCYHARTVSSLSEIYCLQSIKASFEDPLNDFPWTFDNLSEGNSFCNFTGVSCWNDEVIKDARVFSIELRNMGLKGQFPRGIQNCTSLQSLDLSGNHIFGSIPPDIFCTKIPYAVSLDLSNNSLSGEIPPSIANCTFLNTLLLDNNELEGQIPGTLGLHQRLKNFSVSNNLLSGPVPNFAYITFEQDIYANNRGLCGGPLKPCRQRSTFDYSFKSGFVVGFVFLSIVSAIAISMSDFVPCGLHVEKRKKMIPIPVTTMFMIMKKNKRTSGAADQLLNKEISMLEKLIKRTSLADITEATNNFSEDNVIGIGQMGTMYKATLPNGQFLAVKKLHASPYLEEPFLFELKNAVRLRHDNIVQLVGFCVESNQMLLAYEYVSNGNLHDLLHPTKGEPNSMEWPLRVKIATGLARALAWLHHDFGVVHLGISSKCILLDQNFEPKLSNFSEAMHLNPNESDSSSTRSFCVNREFLQLDFVKDDVHSFGLVLLELITGKDPIEIKNSSNGYDGTLNEWISDLLNSSSMFSDEAIDKNRIGRGFDGEIFQLIDVAFQCLQTFPDQRPTMLQVHSTLSTIGRRYGLADTADTLMQDEVAAANTRDDCIESEITQAK